MVYTLQGIYVIVVLKTCKFTLKPQTYPKCRQFSKILKYDRLNLADLKKNLKVKLQVKKLRVKFGGFLENRPNFHPSLFLPATILPAIIIRSKVNAFR